MISSFLLPQHEQSAPGVERSLLQHEGSIYPIDSIPTLTSTLTFSMAAQATDQTRYLRFQLYGGIPGLLPLADLAEVMSIHPTEILPLPHVPGYVLGIGNWRGEAIWILDLACLLGGIHLSQRPSIPASGMGVVIAGDSKAAESQGHDQQLALFVDRVETIEAYDPQETVQDPTSIISNSQIQSLIAGTFLDHTGQPLILLNTQAIQHAFFSL